MKRRKLTDTISKLDNQQKKSFLLSYNFCNAKNKIDEYKMSAFK